jgi:hypothetical protein
MQVSVGDRWNRGVYRLNCATVTYQLSFLEIILEHQGLHVWLSSWHVLLHATRHCEVTAVFLTGQMGAWPSQWMSNLDLDWCRIGGSVLTGRQSWSKRILDDRNPSQYPRALHVWIHVPFFRWVSAKSTDWVAREKISVPTQNLFLCIHAFGMLGYFNAVVRSIFGFRKQSSYWQRSEIYLHLVVPSP